MTERRWEIYHVFGGRKKEKQVPGNKPAQAFKDNKSPDSYNYALAVEPEKKKKKE